MKKFECREDYPFSKFNTSQQLILFKDSLKRMIYHDYEEIQPHKNHNQHTPETI